MVHCDCCPRNDDITQRGEQCWGGVDKGWWSRVEALTVGGYGDAVIGLGAGLGAATGADSNGDVCYWFSDNRSKLEDDGRHHITDITGCDGVIAASNGHVGTDGRRLVRMSKDQRETRHVFRTKHILELGGSVAKQLDQIVALKRNNLTRNMA